LTIEDDTALTIGNGNNATAKKKKVGKEKD
jgi:hypothetical protein